MMNSVSMYHAVLQDDVENLCEIPEKGPSRGRAHRNCRSWWIVTFTIISNIVLASVVVLQSLGSDLIASELFYRPGSIGTITRRMNGTLFPPRDQSWSRLGPGPEADALWEWYEPIRLMPLSRSDLIRMGKDPEKSVQFPDEWDVPKGSYIGAIDVFHKIHCLNELRRMTFEGYLRPDQLPRKHSPLQWIHLRHCVDMIAQDLQCNAKPEVIAYTWMDTHKQAYPDFSISRTCTNWDDFMDWTSKSIVDNKRFPDLRRPKGVQPVPADDGHYKMFGFNDSVLYPAGKGFEHGS